MQRLASAEGFSCDFEQTIFYNDGSSQHYSGHLIVAKKGRFRWQYNKPYEQLYVSDGHGIWLYEPDLMQAQWLQTLDAVDPVAMRFLEGSLRSSDITLLPDSGVPDLYHVHLANGPKIWLALDNEKSIPKWLESEDALENRNRISLHHIMFGMQAEESFVFLPLDGVDIIGKPDE